MTRHIFALLALLTGLAAIGSPAQASLAEALSCDASIAANATDEGARGEVVRVESLRADPRANLGAKPALPAEPAPTALRLPVLMGIERAYE